MSGTASLVMGMRSLTMFMKTVRESSTVTPERMVIKTQSKY